MRKSCTLVKTCFICEQTKHNLEFRSNGSQRSDLKPYCSSCEHIYKGIKEGKLPEALYKGKNYDTKMLQEVVLKLDPRTSTYAYISKEEATSFVKQGAAHVISPQTIELFPIDASMLRLTVLRRDENTCAYCGKKGATVDHILPRASGGVDSLLNLTCACSECNQAKSSQLLHEFLRRKVPVKGKVDFFLTAEMIGVYVEGQKKGFGNIKRDEAKKLIRNKSAFVKGKNQIFILNSVKEEVEPLLKNSPCGEKDEQELFFEKTLSSEEVELYLQNGKGAIGKITKQQAKGLILKEQALVKRKDQIYILPNYVKHAIDLLMKNKEEPKVVVTSRPQPKKKKMPKGSTIGVFNGQGECIGNIHQKIAHQLIQEEKAELIEKKKNNTIRLLLPIEEEIEWIERFEIHTFGEFQIKGTSVGIRDWNGRDGGGISSVMAIQIIEKKLGHLIKNNLLQLLRSKEEINQELGGPIFKMSS